MADKKQTLKELFSNDPEMLRVLEAREQTALLKEVLGKKVSLDGIAQIKGEKGDKGDKGDDGYTPQKGQDYFTEEEIADFLDKSTPIKGIHYFDGEKGESGKDGYNGANGRDGKDGKDGKNGKNGKDGVSVDLDEVIDSLIEKIKKDKPIDISHIRNADQFIFNGKKYKTAELMHGGGSGGGSPAMLYDLSSQLNGVTKSFTIPANTAITLVTGSNAPFIFAPLNDYTGSGTTTLTFTANVDASSALAAGGTLIVQYY